MLKPVAKLEDTRLVGSCRAQFLAADQQTNESKPTKFTAMKKIHIHTWHPKRGGPALGPVRFEFTHRSASTVCLAGTFNGWHPTATPMTPSRHGRWLKELLLPSGACEYCLVVDGKWMANSLATETVRNLLGRLNSIVKGGLVRLKGSRPSPDALPVGGKAADFKTQFRL